MSQAGQLPEPWPGLSASGGAAGGMVYVLLRQLLPRPYRAVLTGLLAGLVGGAMVVHPEGIDFKVLSPLWLAVVMFVALPGLYGALTSKLAESLGAKTSSRVMPWLGVLALPALLPVIGIGSEAPLVALGVLIVVAGPALASMRVPAIGRLAASPSAIWVGRLALAAVAGWSGFLLAKDIAAIL